jgi:hypothetical protein
MNKMLENLLQVELVTADQRRDLMRIARERNWGLALLLVGWLHLVAFSLCHYLTIVRDYHDAAGYVQIWVGELLGVWLIFRICGGSRRPGPLPLLERFIRRVWIAYFVLAFNLGSLNTLRGHHMFEFFPAMASLAAFAFILMSVVVNWRFFGAVPIMFFSGLWMAADLPHSYLIFAVAWCVVLNGVGATLLLNRRHSGAQPGHTRCPRAAATPRSARDVQRVASATPPR